jgi:hypothetical protein
MDLANGNRQQLSNINHSMAHVDTETTPQKPQFEIVRRDVPILQLTY